MVQQTLLASDDMIPAMAILIGGAIVLSWTIGSAIRKSSAVKQREISRREIAAYVAEGSMTPEQGERLMNAGPDDIDNEDLHSRIADHVANGSMSPQDAERLMRAGRSPKAG